MVTDREVELKEQAVRQLEDQLASDAANKARQLKLAAAEQRIAVLRKQIKDLGLTPCA